MDIHFITTFIVDKENGKPDGKLRMRVRWSKDNRVAVNLGYRVTLAKWNNDSQRAVINSVHPKRATAREINAEIQRYEQVAAEVFRAFEVKGVEPTQSQYREELRKALGRTRETGMMNVASLSDRFLIENGGSQWAEMTFYNLSMFFNALNKTYAGLAIETMATSEWMDKYVSDLTELGTRTTTIRVRTANVKTFLKWCQKKGYLDENYTAKDWSYKPRTLPKTVVWLSWDELMRINDMEFGTRTKLDRNRAAVRDMFLLSCFTSLRHSDIENLKWSSIDENGIHIVIQKTSKPVNIELNKYSRAVLERCRSRIDNIYPEYVFPRLSRHTVRDRIKEIARRAGITEPVRQVYYSGGRKVSVEKSKYELLSMHCGRRTFICNALEMGISPTIVMKWTGHSGYTSMKPYIDISDKAKSDAMSLFNK